MGVMRLQGRNGRFAGRVRGALPGCARKGAGSLQSWEAPKARRQASPLVSGQAAARRPAQAGVFAFGKAGKRAALPARPALAHRMLCHDTGTKWVARVVLVCSFSAAPAATSRTHSLWVCAWQMSPWTMATPWTILSCLPCGCGWSRQRRRWQRRRRHAHPGKLTRGASWRFRSAGDARTSAWVRHPACMCRQPRDSLPRAQWPLWGSCACRRVPGAEGRTGQCLR